MQQTIDHGYIITGWTASFGNQFEVYLIKTDEFGDTTWTRTYGGGYADRGYSVLQTADSGYIIAGETCSFGASYSDVYLIKTDASGDTIWTKRYSGGGSSFNWAESIQKTTDGGYIIAGTYRLNNAYLLKTDSLGDTLWTRWFGGPQRDQFFSVQQTVDSGYIAVGYTESFGAGSCDVYLVKTNAVGDTLWTGTYGGIHDDVGKSVQQTSGGGYIIVGTTESFGPGYKDIYLILTGANGDTLWTRTYGGLDTDISFSVQVTADSGYIMTGYTKSYGAGDRDVYLVKTEPDVGIREYNNESFKGHHLGATILRGPLLLPEDKNCRIFDITGRMITHDKIKPGIYFIEIDGVISHKVIKIK